MKRGLKAHQAEILTILGAIGVIGTTVLSSRSAIKAYKLIEQAEEESEIPLATSDKLRIAIPVYIPTIVIGVGSIVCILGSNVISRRTQASISSAYMLLQNSYKEYRESLIELHGEEADKEVRDNIVTRYCDYHVTHQDEPDAKVTWFEPISKQTLCCYEKEIIDAEYHINRNYTLGGAMCVNEYLVMLGLEPIDGGDEIGWYINDEEIYWIDFEHRLVQREGKAVYAIDTLFEPRPFDEWE